MQSPGPQRVSDPPVQRRRQRELWRCLHMDPRLNGVYYPSHLLFNLLLYARPPPPPDTHTPTNPTTPASLALLATAHPHTIISRLFLLLAVMVNNFHDPG